jgi:cytochrome c oxidase assembly factor CtaG/putative copper export protein
MTSAGRSEAVRSTRGAAGVRQPHQGRQSLVPVLLLAFLASAVALVVSLLAGGGQPVSAPSGLPDAGPVIAWGVRGSRLLIDVAAVLTLGSLVTAALLIRSDGPALLGTHARRAVRTGGLMSVAWALAAAAALLLGASDTTGEGLADLSVEALRASAERPQGRALVLTLLLAVTIACSAPSVRSVRGSRCLLLIAVAGLLPVPLAGHASSAVDRDVALSALAVHVVAAALWIGGLVGLLVHTRKDPALLLMSARRFSALAMCSYVALGGAGLLVATVRIGTRLEAWTSGYGAIVAAKAGMLLLLGVVGALHRRKTLPHLAVHRPGLFVRLAGAEVVLIAATAGMAAALSMTPPPVEPVEGSPVHGSGHPSLPTVIEPFSWGQLVTAWRVNAVVLVILGLALAAYAAWERAVARAGKPWPRSRGIAFRSGIVLMLVTACSGVATYAPAMISVQIAQLLVALLIVPLLLGLGAPMTLWLQLRQHRVGAGFGEGVLTSPVARVASDVLTGAALVCGLLIALYRSPLIEVSLRSTWVHLLVLFASVAAGSLLLWPLLGLDPVPRPRGRAERAAALGAVAGCLGLLGTQLGYGDRLLAGTWFLELRWGWVDPVADQHAGAGFLGVAAALVLVAACAQLFTRRR